MLKDVQTYNLLLKHYKFDLTKNFNIDKNFLIKDFSNMIYVLIRFEEINERKKLFKSIGFNYADNHTNITTPKSIKIIFSKEKINMFYNEYAKTFYSLDEYKHLTQKYKL